MHIVVCVKQVPDSLSVKFDQNTNVMLRDGVASILNPFDAYAVEEALRLKEKLGGSITAISVGPVQAESAIREAIAMGVDKGILVNDPALAGSDAWSTGYVLALAIKKLGDAGLIICGKQAADGETAQVGPGIAAHLNIPQITYVRKIDEIDDKHIIAQRLLEEGHESIESSLPCVLTVIKEINEPRIASLKGKMAAKKAQITKWTAQDVGADAAKIGLAGSTTKVLKIFAMPARQGGQIFTGEPEQVIGKLVEQLKDVVTATAK